MVNYKLQSELWKVKLGRNKYREQELAPEAVGCAIV